MGYHNWERTPRMSAETIVSGPPRDTQFNDYIYWAQKPEAFSNSVAHGDSLISACFPVDVLLHFIGVEWLTMCEYIRTRLEQISGEIRYPSRFAVADFFDDTLPKLHVWQRQIPLYREMLNEAIRRISSFPTLRGSAKIDQRAVPNQSSNRTGTNIGEMAGEEDGNLKSTIFSNCCEQVLVSSCEELQDILADMDEYQRRGDRLIDVTSTMISITDSRRALQAFRDSKNVGRLTWLAAIFIPLNFVCALFSMQPDVTVLHKSIKRWFTVALPLSAATVGLVYIVSVIASVSIIRKWLLQAFGRDRRHR